MEAQVIFDRLKDRFGDAVIELQQPDIEPIIQVAPEALADIAGFLKNDPELLCDYLMCITGVDIPPPAPKKRKTAERAGGAAQKEESDTPEEAYECAVIYHMYSFARRHRVTMKAQMPREGATVPTVTHLWQAANWHEREAYDLLGVNFEGHPDLRRILLPDDWEGHPLRKDYEVQEFYNIEGQETKVPR